MVVIVLIGIYSLRYSPVGRVTVMYLYKVIAYLVQVEFSAVEVERH